MRKRILICYSFDKIDPGKRKQFDRRLFGTVENTHGGKYQTTIKGILTGIKYEKPVKSVIIISKSYLKKVLEVLKEFSAETQIYTIL